MNLNEMRRAVERLSDITVGELAFTQFLVDYAIQQATVDVLSEELARGNYSAGSQVYEHVILNNFRPLDSYDNGSPQGVPVWGQLFWSKPQIVLDPNNIHVPLFLESASIIEPIVRRCVYLPPDQFLSTNTLPMQSNLKREYSFTIISRQVYATSIIGGIIQWSIAGGYDSDPYVDYMYVFTLNPTWEMVARAKVSYWREPRLPLTGTGSIELPDYLHNKVVHRAVQYVTMQMAFHPHPQVQMAGGIDAVIKNKEAAQQ